MKRTLTLVLIIGMAFSMVACGSAKSKEAVTAESLLSLVKEEISTVGEIIVYDENTDPNENLGRPGNYICKADFEDIRVETFGDKLSGGTVEGFSSKSDCNDRYNYLSKFLSADIGALGLNQYMYKYDLVIFRVTYDITPEEAKEYENVVSNILGETAKTPK